MVGTSGLTGPWDVPGSRRAVHTSDGRELREEVTAWERPRRFAYRVDGFTSVLGRLVTHAFGEWEFSTDGPGSGFRWTYTFAPRSVPAGPAMRAFVRMLWAGYMSRCADRCVELAER